MDKIYSIQIRGSGTIEGIKVELYQIYRMLENNKTIETVWRNNNAELKLNIKKQFSQVSIEDKIEEGKQTLKKLDVPEIHLNRMCILTFLALCSITPETHWKEATNEHQSLSNDIMKFVSENYNMTYKANSRESFRREGINILLNYRIIDINPGNPNLGPTSPLTHYAIKENTLKQIQKL